MKVFRAHLLLCGGTACHASGSLAVKKALIAELDKKGLSEEIKIVETGCNGFCALGPIMVVYPEGVIYTLLKPEDIPELVEEHLVKGRLLQRLLYKEPTTEEVIPTMQEIPFFALQELRVLRNRGLIDPEKIDEYIARDGYAGMAKALSDMSSEEIIKEVLNSGLRGRGGAGFPTGLKWKFASQSKGDVKYILCNADEGDPGAFMDRSVLEADPHAVIEGMVIAAKAIDAHQGYIYCRAEYPLAVQRLNIAIAQAKEYGLLGKDILGTGFDFDLEIYQGAGAFVCGEETALMTSIEGKRGMPRPRPPFPAVSGLWGKPSVLNNVETLANIGQIILRGSAWYANIGTEKSKGTKGELKDVDFLELRACTGGCVGSPLSIQNVFVGRVKLKYLVEKYRAKTPYYQESEMLNFYQQGRFFSTEPILPRPVMVLDDDVSKALLKMERLDKITNELPGLDCGACGAPSCRALAEDIIRGLAVETDCIFKLRERVQTLAEEVLDLARKMPPAMGHDSSKEKGGRK